MPHLRAQLEQCFQGRVCLMGLGNVAYGDDGFGVRLAELMKSEGRSPKAERRPKSEGRNIAQRLDAAGREIPDSDFEPQHAVIVAGTTPERFIGWVTQRGFDHLIFLDAVDFGGVPGSMILLNSEQMGSRFPQVSTHKVSLGLLAKWAEANGTTRAWLLGVQPESLRPGAELTATLQVTLDVLRELLREVSEEVPA